MGEILSLYICIEKHHDAHLKYLIILYVSHTSIKLKLKKKQKQKNLENLPGKKVFLCFVGDKQMAKGVLATWQARIVEIY